MERGCVRILVQGVGQEGYYFRHGFDCTLPHGTRQIPTQVDYAGRPAGPQVVRVHEQYSGRQPDPNPGQRLPHPHGTTHEIALRNIRPLQRDRLHYHKIRRHQLLHE